MVLAGVISVEELRGFVWGGPEEAEAAVRRVEEGRAKVVAPLPLTQALSAPRSVRLNLPSTAGCIRCVGLTTALLSAALADVERAERLERQKQ